MVYSSKHQATLAVILFFLAVAEGSTSEAPLLLNDGLQALEELLGFRSMLVSPDEALNSRFELCDEMIVDSLENLKAVIQRLEEFGETLTEDEIDEVRGNLTYAIIGCETCLDTIDEVKALDIWSYQRNRMVIKILTDSLKKGRELVSKSLSIISTTVRKDDKNLSDFPYWFAPEDQKTLLGCNWIPNVTVSKDGTGDFRTVNEAVAKIPENGISKFVIHVKEGVYIENVVVSSKKNNVVMYGEGKSKTIVLSNLNRFDKPNFTTFQTATFSVRGNRFVVMDMTFANTAGPEKNQAVAFHSRSSQSVMYRCTFYGFQDTLYAHAGEQFYRECDIIGTVDFIFGAAAAIFQGCNIQSRKPLPKQINTVTAQAASDQYAKSGFVIVGSTILSFQGEHYTTYLGRPWKPFATVIVMKTFLGDVVDPKGWIAWNNEPPPTTLTYGEYMNTGPGSDISNRVNWIGYKPKLTDQEAQNYSVNAWINRERWLNETCIPFDGSVTSV